MAAERIEGVDSARFAYPEGTGTISYDTTVTSPDVFIPELERATGYRMTPFPMD